MGFWLYGGRTSCPGVASADALEVRDLTVSYPGHRRPALRQAWLRVPRGTRIALVGANGAGKSTLLKAMAGLLAPTSGTIRIAGHVPGACHHRVVYLPQRSDLDWRFPLTVEELVLAGRYVHLGWFRRPGKDDRRRSAAALESLGLSDLARRQIGELSGGQQQRALLARCLVQEADILLLDEPLNAVDAATIHVISEVLAGLQAQGKTVVAATHDLGRLETDYDGALYLAEGLETAPPPGSFQRLEVGRAAFGPSVLAGARS